MDSPEAIRVKIVEPKIQLPGKIGPVNYFFLLVMATISIRRRNEASLLASFSILKRNEPAYYRTCKDRSKANPAYSTP
jgi:hypothetical protein